uniref:Zinc finger CCHC domain-containing protein 17 n=1 Tax=Balaenoptera musculus TaxID=9771 RepID=A0A8C0CBT6_BALMU
MGVSSCELLLVAMVTDYGDFIKIPGCWEQGLVHGAHMSSCHMNKPSEIVDVGDKVWVKLSGWEMKNDRIKVFFSMKVVNQGTGKDLDPSSVITEQEERWPSRITLGSHLTLTAQTLRMIQAREQGMRQKTARQQRRRKRRRSTRRSTMRESGKSRGVGREKEPGALCLEALAPGKTQ